MAKKGVVLSWSKGKAVVLAHNGSFVSVPTKQVPIGSEITISRKLPVWRLIAAALILLVCGSLVLVDNYALAYVTIEMDSSVELGINWRNTVVSATAADEEGAKLLQNNSVKGQGLDTALEKIATAFAATASPDSSESVALVSVTGKVKAEHIQETAQAALEKALGKQENEPSQVVGVVLPAALRREAKESGVSPGQYALALKAAEQGQDVTTEEIKAKGLQKALENAGAKLSDVAEAAQDEKNFGQVNQSIRDKVRGGPPQNTPGKGPK